ncbi:unnamed protein product [Bursaphelenchus xylophilus]|uniref:2-(3-amino-3-carboxypropyl)histidine synthase subunit 2 n=1 Tax=Bursaphelenchus xylophilus TaxID=6326 RepID=A0A1I7SX11_BURXY|nr:unnamed protein product [Bursaphelenchus xylophilus]CAG9100102.1 unnamed protein product [Bursaphelenchus xylophilus]
MSADPSALKLFSDDIENREEEQDIESIEVTDKVEVFFENQKAIEWIKRGSFQRVALQLPDSLLKYAYEVATDIEEKSGAKIYILADTSYRNCCVDVIAAEHSNCDALIHYGEACLSEKTDKIPVLYIFCRLPVDFRDFKVKFDQYLEKNRTESTKTIVLLYDSVYSHTSEQLKKVLEKRNLNIIECKTVGEVVEDEDVHLGRRIDKNIQEEESLLVFVGQRESALLPIWLMTFPKYNKIVWYQPKEKVLEKEISTAYRQLRKRMYLIERLKDAKTIGLVIGTLGTKNGPEAIKRVRRLCEAAQKKLYVFAIGKLNEAKLSNFSGDIDAFILLSCPLGVLLDANEFLKPILSLFEAEIALNPASPDWFADAGWTAEYSNLLENPIEPSKLTDRETDVSLISGRIRNLQTQTEENDKKEIVLHSAGDYFMNRTWKGLDDECGQESTELKQGLKGVAMGYKTEPGDKKE